MKKLIFFICFGLILAPCFSQTNVKICDKQLFEWIIAAEDTSEIVFQTSYNHLGTSWQKLDTIIGNDVRLTANLYTSYNLISIDGDTDVPHENLAFDVVENPDASINIDGFLLNIKMNAYCNEFEIFEADDDTILYKMSWETPPNDMCLTLPKGSYYAIFTDNSGANCKKTIPVRID